MSLGLSELQNPEDLTIFSQLNRDYPIKLKDKPLTPTYCGQGH